MVRFDGYSATTQAANPYQLFDLFGPGFVQQEGRGFHSFGHRVGLRDASGSEVGAVMWGGAHGDRSMIEVKGEHSPRVVEALRSAFPHRATRLDSCADFDAPGAFEAIVGAMSEVKTKHRLQGEIRGDWDDFPELGRTKYLGAAKSPVRCRGYEKGKQREYAHLNKPNWARLEVQVRPAKEAKTEYASLSALEVWGASKWTRDLAAAMLKQHIDPHPAGTVYRKTDLDRRIDWVCMQAGPTILELVEACGSWECAALTLRDRIAELRSKK